MKKTTTDHHIHFCELDVDRIHYLNAEDRQSYMLDLLLFNKPGHPSHVSEYLGRALVIHVGSFRRRSNESCELEIQTS